MLRLTQAMNQSEIVRYLASFFVWSEPVMVRIPVLVETAERADRLSGLRL
ncbi:MAG: hypothetical protein ACSHX3_07520 [Litorimonas sp.]